MMGKASLHPAHAELAFMVPSNLYRPALGLLTDLYQITMAYAAYKGGLTEREAVFTLSFRTCPFGGGFALACGLAQVADHMLQARFDTSDLDYLGQQRGGDGAPLFEPAFLEYLGRLSLACDLDAVPEGTPVFPHEPLLRLTGPIIPAMLLETPLLNAINFQTLVATKAARLCLAARGDPVIDFGLRRAQGIDGALSASRAAFVGGCSGTSNVLAGKLFDIPVKGTHAHSWVMLFADELEAFSTYARALPGNCILLVDTYDSLAGVNKAIEVGRWLRQQGHDLRGIRLDSGDLAELSREARRLLDAAGFDRAMILGSNALDEELIQRLKQQGATIGVWGVGTRLVTGHPDAALDGVYKLGAVRDSPGKPWSYRLKLSEQGTKASLPGILQVRRYASAEGFVADAIYDQELGFRSPPEVVDLFDPGLRRPVGEFASAGDLLVPVVRRGKLVAPFPSLATSRRHAADQLARLPEGSKRLAHPESYRVGLERGLSELRDRLVHEARGSSD